MRLSTTDLVLASDASIDLQLHTLYSDGKWTPEQLMDYLVGEQFELAAITDHDRVDTAVGLQQLALEKGLPLLVAVEMTTAWKGQMTDILCYGFDPEKNALQSIADDVLHRQKENSREVYENLRRKGLTFAQEPDALLAILNKPSAQQPHEFVSLVKRNDDGSSKISAGQLVMEAGVKFATAEISAVVEAAHQSGALALIAHPGRDDGFVPFDVDALDQLRGEVPIDGLEVNYPLHSPEQIAMYLDYAEKHGFLTSSGSDSHSEQKKPIRYPANLSRNLLERLGIRLK